MCTEYVDPGAKVAMLHARVCVGTDPLMWHAVPVCESIDHDTPAPLGSGSFTDTFVAVPVSALVPGLVMVTVKPMSAPALTTALSAALATWTSGGSTTIVALACLLGALVADTVAVFGYVPALVASVWLVTWKNSD